MTVVDRGENLQWAIACFLGIALGVYVLGISWFPQKLAHLLVLAMVCPFIAAIVGNIRRLLLTIIILDIPFQLDIHLFYQNEAAALGALGGLSLSVTTLCLVALYALWLIELGTGATYPARNLFRMSLPLTVYLAFVALSALVARSVSLSLFEIALLLQMYLLYVYVVGTVRTRQDLLFIVMILLIGLILESLIMIALPFAGQSFRFGGIFARIYEDMRVGGTVGSANSAAGFLCLLLAPSISIVITRLGRYYKSLAALAFFLGGIALVLTLTRGGWIAFALSVTVLCVLAWRRGWLSTSFLSFIAVVAVILSLLFYDTILARLLRDAAGSAYSRIPLMKLAFRMIMDNPVLGVGSNNFAAVMMQYAKSEFSGTWFYTVHNKYLLVWTEAGIGALGAFIWFLIATLRRGWQCYRLNDVLLAPLALGFTSAVAGHMVHMNVDLFNGRPDIQLLWLVAALITAMYNMIREENVNTYGE